MSSTTDASREPGPDANVDDDRCSAAFSALSTVVVRTGGHAEIALPGGEPDRRTSRLEILFRHRALDRRHGDRDGLGVRSLPAARHVPTPCPDKDVSIKAR